MTMLAASLVHSTSSAVRRHAAAGAGTPVTVLYSEFDAVAFNDEPRLVGFGDARPHSYLRA